MYKVLMRGAELTNGKLNNILKHVSPYQAKVIRNYKYLIPTELLDDEDEAVRFVICLIPNAGSFTAGMVAMQLTAGPIFDIVGKVPEDYWVRTVVKSLIDSHYDKVKGAIFEMRKHKHIPEKYLNRDDLILTVIIQEMYDKYVMGDLTVDAILSNIDDYCHDTF